MRTISNTSKARIELPPFRIASLHFIEILEEIFGNDNRLIVLTGEYNDDTRTELVGTEEIRSNIALIETPLSLEFGSLSLDLYSFTQHIKYDSSESIQAQSISKRLSAHTPSLYYLLGSKYQYALAAIVSVVVLFTNELTYGAIFGALFYGMITKFFAYNAFSLIRDNLMIATIRHRERQGIISRNFDTIFVGFVMVVLGIILGHFLPLMWK